MKNQSTIYSLAKVAKDRLKHNNYDKTRERYAFSNSISPFERYLQENKQIKKASEKTEEHIVVNNYDEELYKKVCKILSSKDKIINPILELIDKNIFKTLDCEAKQQYLNKLNDKYNELKQRYYKEHYLRYLALI